MLVQHTLGIWKPWHHTVIMSSTKCHDVMWFAESQSFSILVKTTGEDHITGLGNSNNYKHMDVSVKVKVMCKPTSFLIVAWMMVRMILLLSSYPKNLYFVCSMLGGLREFQMLFPPKTDSTFWLNLRVLTHYHRSCMVIHTFSQTEDFVLMTLQHPVILIM